MTMMMQGRRGAREIERRERWIQRDAREQRAGKLVSKIPDLTKLDIAVCETSSGACADGTQYVWRIVVENAPAIFDIPCCGRCEDGGYDVTGEILSALSSRSLRFEGLRKCRGQSRDGNCSRGLRYVATATYREVQRVAPGGRVVTKDHP